jgi:uncharacterized protein (DUF927 family)
MSDMSNRAFLSIAPEIWRFGNYLDARGQAAYLVIHYPIRGRLAPKPLVLSLNKAEQPSAVMQELVNAGADIDPKRDQEALNRRLVRDELEDGIFLQKLGYNEGLFVTPDGTYGDDTIRVVASPVILERAQRLFGRKGTLKSWIENVAEPGEKSAYIMFGIMMAFAAAILARVFEGGDEGFLVNYAGGSSRGKTTALMAARSVSGPGNVLSSWEQSIRSLSEEAAAFSDNLMPIDDLDKISSKPGFSRDFTATTHMLTSGEARKYSVAVKEQLPDLHWSFCGMTGAGTTVEELARAHRHRREDHERVRCLDIEIPESASGGIWDNPDKDDSPRDLTDQMKVATTEHYGTALPVWLKRVVGNEKVIAQARKLIDFYLNEAALDEADNIGHRVAKKFGIVYAAGILAARAGILPWDRDDILEVVRDLHRNAQTALHSEADQVARGIEKVLCEIKEGKLPRKRKGKTPIFQSEAGANAFLRSDDSNTMLFIDAERFDRTFVTDTVAKVVRERLIKAGAVRTPGASAITQQVRIRIKDKEFKKRYLVIDLERLEALRDSLKAGER